MLTSVIHDFFHWQTRCHIGSDCHQYWIGKSVAFNGLRRHLSTKQEMTLVDSVVMDEGNSHRVLNFCKPIIYKLSGRDEGSLTQSLSRWAVACSFRDALSCQCNVRESLIASSISAMASGQYISAAARIIRAWNFSQRISTVLMSLLPSKWWITSPFLRIA